MLCLVQSKVSHFLQDKTPSSIVHSCWVEHFLSSNDVAALTSLLTGRAGHCFYSPWRQNRRNRATAIIWMSLSPIVRYFPAPREEDTCVLLFTRQSGSLGASALVSVIYLCFVSPNYQPWGHWTICKTLANSQKRTVSLVWISAGQSNILICAVLWKFQGRASECVCRIYPWRDNVERS